MLLSRTVTAGVRHGFLEDEMKLDGKFFGVIVKAKDNSIVPEDEYVVFLAKDTAFADTLPTYRANCLKLGADAEQIAAMDHLIEMVTDWRSRNHHRLKTPDARGEKLLGDYQR